MKETKPLLEQGTPLERSVLRAALEEGPSPDLERKVLAAMAAARAPMPDASPGRAFVRIRPKTTVIGAAAIGLGVVLVGSLARHVEGTAPVPPTVPALPSLEAPTSYPAPQSPAPALAEPNEVVVTPESLPSAPPSPSETRAVETRPASARASASAPSSPPSAAVRQEASPSPAAPATAAPATPTTPTTIGVSASSASIQREVELLDGVKRNLGAGAVGEASRALDAYDAEFPQGTLRPEATVLRIRTLLARGDRAAAEKLANEFLSTHPSGVHAKRIRALLAE